MLWRTCMSLGDSNAICHTEINLENDATCEALDFTFQPLQFCVSPTFEVTSSKRMEYPTSAPNSPSISSDTLLATDIAATLRGWVQPIIPRLLYPSSCRYWRHREGGEICHVTCHSAHTWVSWVVFPEPVSPTMMITLLSLMTDNSWAEQERGGVRWRKEGRREREGGGIKGQKEGGTCNWRRGKWLSPDLLAYGIDRQKLSLFLKSLALGKSTDSLTATLQMISKLLTGLIVPSTIFYCCLISLCVYT